MEEKRKPFFRRLTKKFFVLLNVFLSAIFIIACYGASLDPETWWFMGLLNLSAPFILIFIILFIIFWLMIRPSMALISIVTILICWASINNIIPFNFSAQFVKQKQNGRLRVMSWNVEHFDIARNKTNPEVKEQMLALINDYQPDVACFQEMVGSDSASAINYMAEIQSRLGFKGYYYSYNTKLDFDRHHHFGVVIFSRLPILNQQTINEYPHDYNSIFQYMDVLYGADTLRLFNIHLQSLRFDEKNLAYIDHPTVEGDGSIKESKTIIKKFKIAFQKRGVQAKRVKAEMDKSPYPAIVCGDFNDVPNSFAYTTIGRNMRNAFEEKGDGLGRTFSSISPTLRIDNIFADKKFVVEQFTRIRKKLSAHFPLIADLTLTR